MTKKIIYDMARIAANLRHLIDCAEKEKSSFNELKYALIKALWMIELFGHDLCIANEVPKLGESFLEAVNAARECIEIEEVEVH